MSDVKRPRGRPRKIAGPTVEREPVREPLRSNGLKMRARPNWETVDPLSNDTPDRLYVSRELIPEGLDALWVTNSVMGQEVPQHRSEFERKGWTPVHQDDFDGQFNGRYMPRDKPGEISVDGLVLMVRPKEMSARAEFANKKKAHEQVAIKEQALRGGDIPGLTLDSRHESAINSNRINKSIERIEIPE